MGKSRWPFVALVWLPVLLSALFLATIHTANATPTGGTLLVTRLDDPTPNGCNVGDCSMREAVLAANAVNDSNAISITVPGTIELSIAGADENLGATGDLDFLYSTRVAGQGPEVTIIDANGLDRVLDIAPFTPTDLVLSPQGNEFEIYGLTVTGGDVIADTDAAGGGVRFGPERSATLQDVVVRNNTATGGTFGLGGGVANNGGYIIMTRTAVVYNRADNAGGVANVDGDLYMVNTTISNNSASGSIGGVINLANTDAFTSTLDVIDTTIAYNIEEAGGNSGAGLDTTAFAGAARTTIQNSIVARNVGETQCFFGGDGSGGGEISSSGYNIDADGSCNLTETTDLPSTDPVLGALVIDTNTYVHLLGNGSPALDSGHSFNSSDLDQRLSTRPVDLAGIPNTLDGDDRGPVEMASELPTAITLSGLQSQSNLPSITGAVVGVLLLVGAGFIAARRHIG